MLGRRQLLLAGTDLEEGVVVAQEGLRDKG